MTVVYNERKIISWSKVFDYNAFAIFSIQDQDPDP